MHRRRRRNPPWKPLTQAIDGAKLGLFNSLGRVVSGWLTSLAVSFIGANSGGASAVLESAIAAASGTAVGLAAAMVGGEELGVGVMSGGWGIAYENLALTYGGSAVSTAMRPLGGYSQLSGYSRLSGYGRPVIVPAGVPRAALRPVSARAMHGQSRHDQQQGGQGA